MENYSKIVVIYDSNESDIKRAYQKLVEKGFNNLSVEFDDIRKEYCICINKGTRDILKDELDDLKLLGYNDAELK